MFNSPTAPPLGKRKYYMLYFELNGLSVQCMDMPGPPEWQTFFVVALCFNYLIELMLKGLLSMNSECRNRVFKNSFSKPGNSFNLILLSHMCHFVTLLQFYIINPLQYRSSSWSRMALVIISSDVLPRIIHFDKCNYPNILESKTNRADQIR